MSWGKAILDVVIELTSVDLQVATGLQGPASVSACGFASFEVPEGADLREWCRAAMLRYGWPLNDITCSELHDVIAEAFDGLHHVAYVAHCGLFEARSADWSRPLNYLFRYGGRAKLHAELATAGWKLKSGARLIVGVDPASGPDESGIATYETVNGERRITDVLPLCAIGPETIAAAKEAKRPTCDWCHQASGAIFSDRITTHDDQNLHPRCFAFAKAHAERLTAGGIDCPEEREATERFMRRKHVDLSGPEPLSEFDRKRRDNLYLAGPCAPLDARIAAAARPPKPEVDPTDQWSAGATPSAEWP